MITVGNLDDTVPVRCNTGDREIYGNIDAAVALGLPVLDMHPAQKGIAVIVGGGPSMRGLLPFIRAHYEQGHTIFALNGATRFLRQNGIKPDYFVLLDSRPDNIGFIDDACQYLIASQCDPSVFAALVGRSVIVWHPNFPGIAEHLPKTPCCLIGGGTTVGLSAIHIAYAMGFRESHLYGFDSSYADTGAGHAYDQPLNRDDGRESVVVGNKEYVAAPWMIRQAMEFQECARQLTDDGAAIYVHGSGLLPAIAREMENPTETLQAVYDLSEAPASWDFVTWLASAEMARVRHGFKELNVSILPGPKDGFRDDTLPDDVTHRRRVLQNVIRPAIGMIGAKESNAVHGWRGGYLARDIADNYAAGMAVPKYRAPEWARKVVRDRLHGRRPVVITLREADHWPERNSNLDAWLEFASRLDDVIFVRDAAKAYWPLPLGMETFPTASKQSDLRMALYEAARLNLGVSNGPMMMLALSDAPYLIFKMLFPGYVAGTAEWLESAVGVPVGGQFPWAKADQRIIWDDDTLAAINRAYDEFVDFEEINVLALAS